MGCFFVSTGTGLKRVISESSMPPIRSSNISTEGSNFSSPYNTTFCTHFASSMASIMLYTVNGEQHTILGFDIPIACSTSSVIATVYCYGNFIDHIIHHLPLLYNTLRGALIAPIKMTAIAVTVNSKRFSLDIETTSPFLMPNLVRASANFMARSRIREYETCSPVWLEICEHISYGLIVWLLMVLMVYLPGLLRFRLFRGLSASVRRSWRWREQRLLGDRVLCVCRRPCR